MIKGEEDLIMLVRTFFASASNIPKDLRKVFLEAKNASLESKDPVVNLNEKEIENVTDYFLSHPHSDLPVKEILTLIRSGKVFSKETKFFNSQTKNIDFPSFVKGGKTKFKPDKDKWPKEMVALAEEREVLREEAKKLAQKHGFDSQVYKDKIQEIRLTSEDLGEKASDLYVKNVLKKDYPEAEQIFPPKDFESDAKQGMFDRIYKLGNGKFLVVEAKGGTSTLGSREIQSGKNTGLRAQQGSPEYLEDVLINMREKGLIDGKFYNEISLALKSKNVEYKEVRQRIDKSSGKLLPIEVKDFDLNKKKKKKKNENRKA